MKLSKGDILYNPYKSNGYNSARSSGSMSLKRQTEPPILGRGQLSFRRSKSTASFEKLAAHTVNKNSIVKTEKRRVKSQSQNKLIDDSINKNKFFTSLKKSSGQVEDIPTKNSLVLVTNTNDNELPFYSCRIGKLQLSGGRLQFDKKSILERSRASLSRDIRKFSLSIKNQNKEKGLELLIFREEAIQ